MITLEELLAKEDDATLLEIERELYRAVVPATGYAHAYIRKINKLIDAGNMCISPTSHRKVYLPTLAKAVHKEMAHRYTECLLGTRMWKEVLLLGDKEM